MTHDHVLLLANVMMQSSSCCYLECDRNSGHKCLFNGFIHSICNFRPAWWELMKSAGNHGSWSLLFTFIMVMVWHFVRDSVKLLLQSSSCWMCYSGDFFLSQSHRHVSLHYLGPRVKPKKCVLTLQVSKMVLYAAKSRVDRLRQIMCPPR